MFFLYNIHIESPRNLFDVGYFVAWQMATLERNTNATGKLKSDYYG